MPSSGLCRVNSPQPVFSASSGDKTRHSLGRFQPGCWSDGNSIRLLFDDRTNPRTIEALKGGPLASTLEAYARRLHEDGYATHSGFVQLRLLGCFNRWLDRKGLTSEDVDAATIERYFVAGHKAGSCAEAILPRCFGCWPCSGPRDAVRPLHIRHQLRPRWSASSGTYGRNAVCTRRR
jgi:hypothetical protein